VAYNMGRQSRKGGSLWGKRVQEGKWGGAGAIKVTRLNVSHWGGGGTKNKNCHAVEMFNGDTLKQGTLVLRTQTEGKKDRIES